MFVSAAFGAGAILKADTPAGAPASSSGRSFDVRTFGAVGDGVMLDTPAIQKAIDACMAAGGGLVLLKGGDKARYVTGSLAVVSQVECPPSTSMKGRRY